ncbi:purine and uridine phosphorylase [Acaromyces ingoldii]|uniref:Purine and uridine phosphorylase n=1 Tax=Acaromyces ingoldii TaxID=215250 RepID=A0A316YK44_9BASI|nr:purine and uridine phosphorylase [Acaromyces ingoldii]PWN89797.1 purine and uridine phosphorylase [Acaromyces ingoldii]
MKDVLLDANFPRDAQGRTYHVGTKAGQVANRIITVGDHVRARRVVESSFDGGQALFEFESQRNFLTLTGTVRGVPITVVAIGMGFSLVDFFVRECAAVVSGDLVIVRLGSCGSLSSDAPIGSVVVPRASVGVTRNYDYFHPSTTAEERASGSIEPYTITKPLDCDGEVHDALVRSLQATLPPADPALFGGAPPRALGNITNASADSFYSSQGRQTSLFVDANANLAAVLQERVPQLQTFEMETFLLNHLAAAVDEGAKGGRIRTGAAQMVFANRTTQQFITPHEVDVLERWAGRAVCEALVAIDIAPERLQKEGVWN